jgi:hypothetical protein
MMLLVRIGCGDASLYAIYVFQYGGRYAGLGPGGGVAAALLWDTTS